ncbi:hypothetical protein GCM10010924_51960 [Rhizobium wenxiniae]|nr:hypothetical protein GCM10010924_51960 [Rhizobium wenxiniae]
MLSARRGKTAALSQPAEFKLLRGTIQPDLCSFRIAKENIDVRKGPIPPKSKCTDKLSD